MKLVDRNEYFKMVSNGVSVKDYDIKPLDLSRYRLSEVTQRIANANFMEETVDGNGNYMLSGHWLSDLTYAFANKCKFDLYTVDAYSSYAFSDEQLAMFTYCEGDITLTPFTDEAEYKKEKERTIKFYTEEY